MEYRQARFRRPAGATEILLVRHGESRAHRAGESFPLVDGHGDPELSELGRAQAIRDVGPSRTPNRSYSLASLLVRRSSSCRETVQSSWVMAGRSGSRAALSLMSSPTDPAGTISSLWAAGCSGRATQRPLYPRFSLVPSSRAASFLASPPGAQST